MLEEARLATKCCFHLPSNTIRTGKEKQRRRPGCHDIAVPPYRCRSIPALPWRFCWLAAGPLSFVVCALYREVNRESDRNDPSPQPASAVSIPLELQCSLCYGGLLKSAVSTPCCDRTYCDECENSFLAF